MASRDDQGQNQLLSAEKFENGRDGMLRTNESNPQAAWHGVEIEVKRIGYPVVFHTLRLRVHGQTAQSD